MEAGPKLLTLPREGVVDSGGDGAAERLAEVAASDAAGPPAPRGSRGQPGDAATVCSEGTACDRCTACIHMTMVLHPCP